MSRWSTVPLHHSLGCYAATWDELNARVFDSHPLLTSQFVEGLLRNFGTGSERLCLLEDQSGYVQAMCILQPRNKLIWRSFLPSQAQISPTLIPHPGMLSSLWSCVPAPVLQVDLLCNDPDLMGWVASPQQQIQRVHHALTMSIGLGGTFADYWVSRHKHLQSNIRRYERRLQADEIKQRLVVISAPDEMSAALSRYAGLEGKGWKGAQGTALGSTAEQYRFYHDLILAAACIDNATAYELWFGDTLVASRLMLRQDQVLVMLKTCYDKDYAAFAPGRLLLYRVIENVFNSGMRGRVEFYTDANSSLLQWSTSQRWIVHASLFRDMFAERMMLAGRGLRSLWREPDALQREQNNAPRVEVATSFDGMPTDATTFLDQAEKHNVEFGTAWYRNLIATVYPRHDGMRFYILRKGTQVVAVLPLRAEKALLGWKLHALSNFYTTLYQPALEDGLKPVELLPLLAAVQQDFRRAASLTLVPMDPASHAYPTLLEALRLHGWFSFEYFAFGNWYQPVDGDWGDYLAKRQGILRSTIKRMGKKFAADGGTLEIVTSGQGLAASIDAYERVYAASWKQPEPYPEFMPGLIQQCAENGTLRLGLAMLDGQPIAAQMWIVSHGRAAIYKLAYHSDYNVYAPGTLLTALLMEHVIDVDHVREIDYLIGDDPYKKIWMTQRRERWGIVAYNPRVVRGLIGLLREAGGRAAKRLLHLLRAALKSSR